MSLKKIGGSQADNCEKRGKSFRWLLSLFYLARLSIWLRMHMGETLVESCTTCPIMIGERRKNSLEKKHNERRRTERWWQARYDSVSSRECAHKGYNPDKWYVKGILRISPNSPLGKGNKCKHKKREPRVSPGTQKIPFLLFNGTNLSLVKKLLINNGAAVLPATHRSI